MGLGEQYELETTGRITPEVGQRLAAPPGSPYPFQCTNCGHKPTPQEVIDHGGDCAKCKDTVIAYTVDAAECILRLMANTEMSHARANNPVAPSGDKI